MRAGHLRRQLKLQREVVAPNSAAGDAVSFTDVATVWADVTTSAGREFFEAKRLTPELTHQVEIRYRAGVGPGMRFLNGSSVLRVLAALDPDGRRDRQLVMCQELVQ